jgi:release factor glutamine methyltransferase
VSRAPADEKARMVAALRAAGCVFAEDEARLISAAAGSPAERAAMVAERAAGVPLELVVGWAEFCGLRIGLDDGVFVPRRRTEFLVQEGIRLVTRGGDGGGGPRRVVLDLCCGSGAVGAALATALAPADLYAVDVDPAAAACARRNLASLGGEVFEGDLYGPLPASLRGRVGVLAANVPYVPSADVRLLPAEAREHEPRVALDGGPDGLAVLRRVTAGAPAWLAPGGVVLTETSERQAPAATRAMAQAGLAAHVARSPGTGATVVAGIMPGGPHHTREEEGDREQQPRR